jgi:hypothetical protein
MNMKRIFFAAILLMIGAAGYAQAKAVSGLRLVNNESEKITMQDKQVSKKFFRSPSVTLESDAPIGKDTEITLMLGEKGIFFENPRLSTDIRQQILNLPAGTAIVFSIEQETLKELKLLLVE